VIFLPVAVAVALFGADQGCLLQAVPILHSTSPGAFLHYHWSAQNLSDNLLAGVDCASQAIFIVIVSCFYGYRAEGGPAAVGSAVARSLLVNIVMVNVLVSFWVCLFYGLNPHIPIGG
jgi:phospholipid/cholesterol/gamma-HCH transport system permease protein